MECITYLLLPSARVRTVDITDSHGFPKCSNRPHKSTLIKLIKKLRTEHRICLEFQREKRLCIIFKVSNYSPVIKCWSSGQHILPMRRSRASVPSATRRPPVGDPRVRDRIYGPLAPYESLGEILDNFARFVRKVCPGLGGGSIRGPCNGQYAGRKQHLIRTRGM